MCARLPLLLHVYCQFRRFVFNFFFNYSCRINVVLLHVMVTTTIGPGLRCFLFLKKSLKINDMYNLKRDDGCQPFKHSTIRRFCVFPSLSNKFLNKISEVYILI